jgi:hypothetical protein
VSDYLQFRFLQAFTSVFSQSDLYLALSFGAIHFSALAQAEGSSSAPQIFL